MSLFNMVGRYRNSIPANCEFKGCLRHPAYVIEWHSLNQHLENPLVADDAYSCGNFAHIFALSHHTAYGGIPDGVVDIETMDIEHPDIVDKIRQAMQVEDETPELLERHLQTVDITGRQLVLPFMR
ncbi:MAG TPA: hypothetical protein VI612_04395 [Candidatus Nanoarchaeia archaeon]|nr:hypothetical protein [Candidatus Nanoarchaeia archaeon]